MQRALTVSTITDSSHGQESVDICCQEISLSWNAELVPAGYIDHVRFAALQSVARFDPTRVVDVDSEQSGHPATDVVQYILRDTRTRRSAKYAAVRQAGNRA